MRLTWPRAAAWRARQHSLDRRVPRADMLEVVSRIGGLHAQVMSSAELSLAARVEGLQPTDVAKALWERRTLVKTWAMRGTLHLLPSAEYRTFQAALSRARHYETATWQRGFGVTAQELAQLLEAVAAALDGPPLTRTELTEAVVRRTGSAAIGEKVGGSWGSLLKPSAYRGELCFGPSTGQNVRFVRPDRWLSLGAPVDPDDAAKEMTRRYLAAYGPATRQDYAHWWGFVTPAQAGRLIAGMGEEVTQVDVAGEPHWFLATQAEEAASTPPLRTVRLLPAFDPYVIAASPHAEHLLAAPFRDRIYRPQGWLSPVVVVGGRFYGVWRSDRKGGRVVIGIEPFVALPAWATKAVEHEAERLAQFLGGRLDLRVESAA